VTIAWSSLHRWRAQCRRMAVWILLLATASAASTSECIASGGTCPAQSPLGSRQVEHIKVGSSLLQQGRDKSSLTKKAGLLEDGVEIQPPQQILKEAASASPPKAMLSKVAVNTSTVVSSVGEVAASTEANIAVSPKQRALAAEPSVVASSQPTLLAEAQVDEAAASLAAALPEVASSLHLAEQALARGNASQESGSVDAQNAAEKALASISHSEKLLLASISKVEDQVPMLMPAVPERTATKTAQSSRQVVKNEAPSLISQHANATASTMHHGVLIAAWRLASPTEWLAWFIFLAEQIGELCGITFFLVMLLAVVSATIPDKVYRVAVQGCGLPKLCSKWRSRRGETTAAIFDASAAAVVLSSVRAAELNATPAASPSPATLCKGPRPVKGNASDSFCPEMVVPDSMECFLLLPCRPRNPSYGPIMITDQKLHKVMAIMLRKEASKKGQPVAGCPWTHLSVSDASTNILLVNCQRVSEQNFAFHSRDGELFGFLSTGEAKEEQEVRNRCILSARDGTTFSFLRQEQSLTVTDASGEFVATCTFETTARVGAQWSMRLAPNTDTALVICGIICLETIADHDGSP